mgnify:CR=1 FL=1
MDTDNRYYTSKKFPFPHNWSEKQYFIYACFVDNLQNFYKEWAEQGRKSGRIQFFDTKGDGALEHKYWKPSNICQISGDVLTNETIDIKVGYFTPFIWKPVHKNFLLKAKKEEAFECQKIDCSCSDCKFVDRENSFCNKFNWKTKIFAGSCHPQNIGCFQHRLDTNGE